MTTMKTDYIYRELIQVTLEEAWDIGVSNLFGAHYDTEAIGASLKDKLAHAKSEVDNAKTDEDLWRIRDKYVEIIKALFDEVRDNATH